MGEIAEATLNGLYCEGCGEVFEDFEEPGYPRRCQTCRRSQREARRNDSGSRNKPRRRKSNAKHGAEK